MKRIISLLLAAVTLSAAHVLVSPVLAESQRGALDPTVMPNEAFITLSGTIVGTSPASFRLDYGSGLITVEMDDFDRYQEGRAFMDNDRVTVYGRIDADAFQTRTIEASSVYVENLGTFFYASSADEEDALQYFTPVPTTLGRTTVTGTVTQIMGRTFYVADGNSRIAVDTSQMPYDPTDDRGYLRIGVGDRVMVTGPMRDALFTNRELEADVVVELAR